MNNHYAAVEDCKRAIDMDPAYGKAYGRMGLAYACVDKHKGSTISKPVFMLVATPNLYPVLLQLFFNLYLIT